MKLLTALLFLLSCGLALAQDMDVKPPAEMAKFAKWVGTWTGKEKMYDPSGTSMESTPTMVMSMSLNGRYLEGRYSSEMMGMKAEGLHMLTYDPAKKKWVAYWFDSMAPGVMEMEGDLDGSKLTMGSKPVDVPGMSAKQIFRANWEMKDENTVAFMLSLKVNNEWKPMIEGTYTRKV